MRINPGFRATVLHEPPRSEEYLEYRRQWSDAPDLQMSANRPGPIHIDLEVTARCQLRCPGCPSTVLTFDKGDIAHPMALKALREHKALGGLSVKFNWRGEPTLYRRLPSLVAEATKLGLVERMINTNGVSLNKKLSIELVEAGISHVAFSMDSADAPLYEKLRPGARFGKVLHNLDTFLSVLESYDDDCYVRVQRIAYPDVEETHEEFVEYFSTQFPRLNAVASNAYKEKNPDILWQVPAEPCAQPFQRMLITFDGQIGPCCESNRFGDEPLGKFPRTSIRDAWEKMAWLRKVHLEGRQNEVPACKGCTVTKVV